MTNFKMKRSYLQYIITLSLVIFTFIIFILYNSLHINTKIHTNVPFPNKVVYSKRREVVEIASKATSKLEVWVITDNSEGASSSDSTIPSKNTFRLPIGTIVIGNKMRNKQSHFEDTIHVAYPYKGLMVSISSAKRVLLSAGPNISLVPQHCQIESNFIVNKDFPGGDIESMNPSNVDSSTNCCIQCATVIVGCSHWAFIDSAKECWFKKGEIKHAAAKEKDGVISGINPSPIKHSLDNSLNNPVPQVISQPMCCNKTSSHGENINSFSVSFDDLRHILPHSPFRLTTHLTNGEWDQQLLIGNGAMGAMVGGSVKHEIVPLSASNLFVYIPTKDDPKQIGKIAKKGKAKSAFNKLEKKGLQDSRNAFLNGDIDTASQILSDLQSTGLGMFSYLADLVFLFDCEPFQIHATKEEPIAKKAGKVPPRSFFYHGRKKIIEDLKSLFQLGKGSKPPSVLLFSDGVLDMENGVATELFVERIDEQRVDIHHREWIMSEEDQIIMGRLQCFQLSGLGEPCLNSVFGLLRDIDPEHNPQINLKSTATTMDSTKSYGWDMSITSSPSIQIPTSHICVLALCIDGSSSLVSSPEHLNNEASVLVCNDASEIRILGSSVSIDALGVDPSDYDSSTSRANDLKSVCWDRLHAASSKDPILLKEDHMKRFSSRMNRVEFQLMPSIDSFTCPSESIYSRLDSFGQGCFNSTRQLVDSKATDSSLVTTLFQMGRYLMISSGSQNPVNLQGIWADGLHSEWNGDYHININMQMHYWAAAPAGLDEVLQPLLHFVHKLSKKGRIAAKTIYQCGGDLHGELAWVAHGFTDSSLRGDILGDLQWSLCVTCGAWISTHIFDLVSFYSIDHDFVLKNIIPIFRGIADFFSRYIYQASDSEFHTGPTGSPENSYILETSNNSVRLSNTKFLTMSPAIDISVLREICNMYVLLTEITNGVDDEERMRATTFRNIILRLPNRGVPSIDPKTKRIREYPYKPKLADEVKEEADLGHRHFSMMHWLYPATFLPFGTKDFSAEESSYNDNIYDAARETMLSKRRNKGGHTAWSAAWEAALWARLGNGQEAYDSITKIVRKYLTKNLLSLHPPLDKSGPDDCYTCFQEQESAPIQNPKQSPLFASKKGLKSHPIPLPQELITPHLNNIPNPRRLSSVSPTDTHEVINKARGLVTSTGAKFQLDGNMGLLAATIEMLVQNYLPGHIIYLPALPFEWSVGGTLSGIRTRGNAITSFSWIKGKVERVELKLLSDHFWWKSVTEQIKDMPGFYEGFRKDESPKITLSFPNQMKTIAMDAEENVPGCKIETEVSSQGQGIQANALKHNMQHITILLSKSQSYPCRLQLISDPRYHTRT